MVLQMSTGRLFHCYLLPYTSFAQTALDSRFSRRRLQRWLSLTNVKYLDEFLSSIPSLLMGLLRRLSEGNGQRVFVVD